MSCRPEPLQSAVEAAVLGTDEIDAAGLRGLHDEHARHALAMLSDLDALLHARRMGVDPLTRKPPRTEKARQQLQQRFAEEPARLEHGFEILMDVYQEAFGAQATDAFRKAIQAWHAGVEVIAERPPCVPPHPDAVKQGVFGQEENGEIVNPTPEEIDAITSELVERLADMEDGPSKQALLAKYAEDFGAEAAQRLEHWTRHKDAVDFGGCGYDPGHSWHYYHEGDAAEPLPFDQIPPAGNVDSSLGKIPRDPKQRHTKLRQILSDQEHQLDSDKQRYAELVGKGVDALSDYDRNIAGAGNPELAWASAIALKYNQIRFAKGRVECLRKALGTSQSAASS